MSESLEQKAKFGKDIFKTLADAFRINYDLWNTLQFEEWVRLEDAQQDKQDTLKTAWSTLEDECKRIQDEIDRGCYSNPLDIIFEVHETVSKCFEKLLEEEKEAQP